MCEFTIDEAGQILGLDTKNAGVLFNKAYKEIQSKSGSDTLEEDLKKLVKHIPPAASINATIDLGHMVKGMKNQSIGSKIKRFVLLFLIASGILIYFYPTEFGLILDQLIGPVEE